MTLAARLSTLAISEGGKWGIVLKGGKGRVERVRANGADLFLTAIVTHTDEAANDPDVDLSAAGEPVSGIIVGVDDGTGYDLSKDSDSPYANNTFLKMYVPEQGDVLLLTIATNTAVTKGTKVTQAGGFVAGDFAYLDGTRATDLLEDVVAVAVEAVGATAATEKIAAFRWLGLHG